MIYRQKRNCCVSSYINKYKEVGPKVIIEIVGDGNITVLGLLNGKRSDLATYDNEIYIVSTCVTSYKFM